MFLSKGRYPLLILRGMDSTNVLGLRRDARVLFRAISGANPLEGFIKVVFQA